MFDSFGARAEDLSTVCEADAQRMRQSMDTDGDGIVSASEVLAFARNVAAAEAATAVKAVRVRCDRLPAVPASFDPFGLVGNSPPRSPSNASAHHLDFAPVSHT